MRMMMLTSEIDISTCAGPLEGHTTPILLNGVHASNLKDAPQVGDRAFETTSKATLLKSIDILLSKNPTRQVQHQLQIARVPDTHHSLLWH
jgi:hypothetical protein